MNRQQLTGLIRAVIEEVIIQTSNKKRISEDFHHTAKEYRLYEGNSHITAMFNDGSKLKFEVHYHNKHADDKLKHRKQAASRWKSLANKIHSDIKLNEVGNPIEKSWKQSFEEALTHPRLQEYIRQPHHKRVFERPDDAGYPKKVQGKVAPVMDPVNFTKTG